MSKKKIAIFSPKQNAYSETFIQAHKTLPFQISFYYGGYFPLELEGQGSILKRPHRYFYKVQSLFSKGLSVYERALKASLRKEKVECVLMEFGVIAAECLNVVKSLEIPIVVHFHGFDATDKEVLKIYEEKYKDVFCYASSVISVSTKMTEDLKKLGCPPEKIILNTYGPNPDFFNIKPHFKKKQFVAIGRFVDKKAPYLTMLAFKKVTEQFAEAELIMGGDGPLLNACKILSKVLGLSEKITFTGVMHPSDIMRTFESSLAFLQHSIVPESGDTEGTPVAILEAGAAGLPVIATYHAGIPDVIKHDETGFLVNELDIEKMAEYMLLLYSRPDRAAELGAASSRFIKEKFSLDRHLQCLTDIINSSAIAGE